MAAHEANTLPAILSLWLLYENFFLLVLVWGHTCGVQESFPDKFGTMVLAIGPDLPHAKQVLQPLSNLPGPPPLHLLPKPNQFLLQCVRMVVVVVEETVLWLKVSQPLWGLS